LHIVRSILGEGVLETFWRHPDQTVSVGPQMGSLRMKFSTVEYLSYCLTLVGSESSNINERSHLLVCCRCDHGTSVRVPNKQNRAVGSLQNAIECSGVV